MLAQLACLPFDFFEHTFIFGRCQTLTDPAANNTQDPKASAEAKAKYVLASEPTGVKGIKEIKQKAKDGEEVVIVGRIGGSKTPFTGRAAFTVVDTSFVPCNEKEEPEDSLTPWDFC